MSARPLRVALVQDWLNVMRGAERVLDVFCEMFPEAPIYSLVHKKGAVSPSIEQHPIKTSFIQRLPGSQKKYRNYLPLFPTAIESFDLKGYDLVLSSSYCVAKGIIPHTGTVHVCYMHTPMRYVYEMYDDYFGPRQMGPLMRCVMPFIAAYLRQWDAASNDRVDHFIANSHNVRARIWRRYRRDATVICPPVDASFFELSHRQGDYYLYVGALVPYKRVDLAIAAAAKLGRRLVIVGDGPERKALEKLAGPTTEFIGRQSDAQVRDWYAGCTALLFPGEEDFGIVPLEAQACGKPVIAFGRGGALETVVDGETGVFFHEPTPESIEEAILRFERQQEQFVPLRIRRQSLRFDRPRFKKRMEEFIDAVMERRAGIPDVQRRGPHLRRDRSWQDASP
ncbi:MAG: glycosyltransferase [Thermoguttaceae bacterium]